MYFFFRYKRLSLNLSLITSYPFANEKKKERKSSMLCSNLDVLLIDRHFFYLLQFVMTRFKVVIDKCNSCSTFLSHRDLNDGFFLTSMSFPISIDSFKKYPLPIPSIHVNEQTVVQYAYSYKIISTHICLYNLLLTKRVRKKKKNFFFLLHRWFFFSNVNH